MLRSGAQPKGSSQAVWNQRVPPKCGANKEFRQKRGATKGFPEKRCATKGKGSPQAVCNQQGSSRASGKGYSRVVLAMGLLRGRCLRTVRKIATSPKLRKIATAPESQSGGNLRKMEVSREDWGEGRPGEIGRPPGEPKWWKPKENGGIQIGLGGGKTGRNQTPPRGAKVMETGRK